MLGGVLKDLHAVVFNMRANNMNLLGAENVLTTQNTYLICTLQTSVAE